MDPAHFWGLTYREIDAILEGNAARMRHEHNQRAWLAWHSGMLSQVKKMPRLKSLMILDAPKPQSIKNMIATAKAWVRALKGK